MKPFLVAVSAHPISSTPFSLDMSDVSRVSGPASVLLPPDVVMTHLNALKTVSPAVQEANLAIIEKEYLEALRSRYGKGGRKADFEYLIRNPMLVMRVDCDLQAMTWQYWGINVLMKLASNQGRNAQFVGRVLPTLFPSQQIAKEQVAEVAPF